MLLYNQYTIADYWTLVTSVMYNKTFVTSVMQSKQDLRAKECPVQISRYRLAGPLCTFIIGLSVWSMWIRLSQNVPVTIFVKRVLCRVAMRCKSCNIYYLPEQYKCMLDAFLKHIYLNTLSKYLNIKFDIHSHPYLNSTKDNLN